MRYTRIPSVLIVLALLLSIAAGCSSVPHVATIDGEKVSADEFSFYLAMERTNLESYFDDVSKIDYSGQIENEDGTTVTLEQALKDRAFAQLSFYRAFTKLAHDNEIFLEDEDHAKIKATKDSAIEKYGSRKDFLQTLKQLGTTEKGYDIASETTVLMEKAHPILFGENGIYTVSEETKNSIQEDFYENYFHCVHVVKYKFDLTTGEDFPESDLIVKRSVMDMAYEAFLQNNDLAAVAKEYSDDAEEGLTQYDYYFSRDDVLDNNIESQLMFLELVEGLDYGEVSAIVEFDDGYYIVQRLELEEDFLETLYEEAQNDMINEKIGAIIAAQSILKTASFDKLTARGI